jgi:Na+/H+ antiporter NhaA
MPAPAVLTLVFAGLLVAGLAFYLIWIAIVLRGVHDTLGKVLFGVRAIAHRTGPLETVLGSVAADLDAIADAVDELDRRQAPAGAVAGGGER